MLIQLITFFDFIRKHMLECVLMLSTKIACATWIYKFQYAKKCKYNIISDLMEHVQKISIQSYGNGPISLINQHNVQLKLSTRSSHIVPI
jgi:hypothetical protein